jgi:hypothetical protein
VENADRKGRWKRKKLSREEKIGEGWMAGEMKRCIEQRIEGRIREENRGLIVQ